MTKKRLSMLALGIAVSVLALALGGGAGNVRTALAQESPAGRDLSAGQPQGTFGPRGYRGAAHQGQAAHRPARPAPGTGVAAKNEALSAAAEAMGMTLEDLLTEIKSGKSIAQVAEDKGVSVDSVKGAMLAALEAALKQKLEAGLISQERYDSLVERLQAALGRWFDATCPYVRGGRALRQGRMGRS